LIVRLARENPRWGRNAEDSNEPKRTGADRNPFAALWTTLSGFESLPPSHVSFLPTMIYVTSKSTRIHVPSPTLSGMTSV